MKLLIVLMIVLGMSATVSAQCPNCRYPQHRYAQHRFAEHRYAEQIMVPQTQMVPYQLQRIEYTPPQPPQWVLGQRWVQMRRAWLTRPAVTTPIYVPQNQVPSPPNQ